MKDGRAVDATLADELIRLQRQIEGIYLLEPTPAIAPFVRIEDSGAREQVIVRQSVDELELAVLLPEASAHALMSGKAETDMDAYLGAVEGISHFIHLAERARTRLPTTLLELELQAEVDKFAVLLEDRQDLGGDDRYDLHRRLYEDVSYLHAAGSEHGRRYRLANGLAAKLWLQLLRLDVSNQVLGVLRRFYRVGQAEKIRMASAA